MTDCSLEKKPTSGFRKTAMKRAPARDQMNLKARVRSEAIAVFSLFPLPWYWLISETLEVPTISLKTSTSQNMVEKMVIEATASEEM